MATWSLCNSLLHKLRLGPGLGKRPHELGVAGGKHLHVREHRAQVVRQPLDHLRPSALRDLPRQDVAPDLLALQDQFAVYRQRGALLGAVDGGFQFLKPVGVAVRGVVRDAGKCDIANALSLSEIAVFFSRAKGKA